jgi:hypothetical protein
MLAVKMLEFSGSGSRLCGEWRYDQHGPQSPVRGAQALQGPAVSTSH